MSPFISIIIPVYKVEDFLEKCVQSVLEQNFHDYELVLVDDGSPDACPKICESYARHVDRVKVVHKANGGLSDARNCGLAVAEGKYVLFIDSDDYIRKESLQRIYKDCISQNMPDVLFLSAEKFFPNGLSKSYDSEMEVERLRCGKKEALEYISGRKMYPASAWSKLVKRKLLLDYNIYFKVAQLSEDYEWTLNLLLAAETFGACNERYYCYRQKRAGSITNEVTEKHFNDLLEILDYFEKKADDYVEYRHEILSFAAYIYRTLLWNAKEYYAENAARIEKYKYLLKFSTCKEIKVIRFIASTAGVNVAVNLLNIYRKMRG